MDDLLETEAWIRERAGRMLASARRYAASDAAAEDMVLEVFSRCAATGDHRSLDELRASLREVAARRVRSQSGSDESRADAFPRFKPDGSYAESPRSWPQRRHRTHNDALTPLVGACLDEIPDVLRLVLVMVEESGGSLQPAVEVLGLTERQAKQRLGFARHALRGRLDVALRERSKRIDAAEYAACPPPPRA